MIPKKLQHVLIANENNLLVAQKARDVASVEAMLSEDFYEICSRDTYSRAEALRALQQVEIPGYLLNGFEFTQAAPNRIGSYEFTVAPTKDHAGSGLDR